MRMEKLFIKGCTSLLKYYRKQKYNINTQERHVCIKNKKSNTFNLNTLTHSPITGIHHAEHFNNIYLNYKLED